MKLTSIISLSLLFIFLLCSCKESKPVFNIPEGHVGMFGYGSLMSKKLIEDGLLGKKYDGPFVSAHLNGFQRSWSFSWPTHLPSVQLDSSYYKEFILVDGDTVYPQKLNYLNIKENAESTINGVLYIVPVGDLAAYDRWELGYERFEVTQLILDYTIEGGSVFAYKALPNFDAQPTSDYNQNIVELNYTKIIEDAFDYWGAEFEQEYRNSTVPFDTFILRDIKKVIWVDPPMDKINELKAMFDYGIH